MFHRPVYPRFSPVSAVLQSTLEGGFLRTNSAHLYMYVSFKFEMIPTTDIVQDRPSFASEGETGPTMGKLRLSTCPGRPHLATTIEIFDANFIPGLISGRRIFFDSTLRRSRSMFSAIVEVRGQHARDSALPRSGHILNTTDIDQEGKKAFNPLGSFQSPTCLQCLHPLARARCSSRVPTRAKTRNDTTSTASHFQHYQESSCVSKNTMAPLQHHMAMLHSIHAVPNFRRGRLAARRQRSMAG
ncbi:hypothetical protein QBC39DRAFT_6303 [Podospora conica]|nr:hypothetical protein QBC39DRAFT_6303 [Schizothecium conicum]